MAKYIEENKVCVITNTNSVKVYNMEGKYEEFVHQPKYRLIRAKYVCGVLYTFCVYRVNINPMDVRNADYVISKFLENPEENGSENEKETGDYDEKNIIFAWRDGIAYQIFQGTECSFASDGIVLYITSKIYCLKKYSFILASKTMFFCVKNVCDNQVDVLSYYYKTETRQTYRFSERKGYVFVLLKNQIYEITQETLIPIMKIDQFLVPYIDCFVVTNSYIAISCDVKMTIFSRKQNNYAVFDTVACFFKISECENFFLFQNFDFSQLFKLTDEKLIFKKKFDSCLMYKNFLFSFSENCNVTIQHVTSPFFETLPGANQESSLYRFENSLLFDRNLLNLVDRFIL